MDDDYLFSAKAPQTDEEMRAELIKLRMICRNQEIKLHEHDAAFTDLNVKYSHLQAINDGASAVQKFVKYLISLGLILAGIAATIWAARGGVK